MSIHPSLSTSKKIKQKSVLKRIERIKFLKEKNLWHDGDSVLGLPKIKVVRIKIKKEKAAEKTETTATTTSATETSATSKTTPVTGNK